MRVLLFGLLTLVLLAMVSPPVLACINDREVSTYEREFKSNYIDKPAAQPISPADEEQPAVDRLWAYAVTAVGGMLLAGAFLLGLLHSGVRS